MALIDKTYFVKDINIPDSDYSDLDNYIDRYEREILIQLLGYELYVLVAAYDESPGVITDFVEGKTYTVNGKVVRWNGLINTQLISLIAYYVYYKFVNAKAQTLSTTGMIKQVNENSDNTTPVFLMTNAWSNLIRLYQSTEYPYESAYTFLTENSSDYPEWEFTSLGSVNAWDL